ncbi:MAG: hypothetical protein ACXWQE_10420 [Bdellovibrionales bacterium]
MLMGFAFLSVTVQALELIPEGQWVTARNVVEFQPFAEISGPVNKGQEQLRLINLNRHVNMWYLLEISDSRGVKQTVNLENPYPLEQKLSLAPSGQLLINSASASIPCAWNETKANDPYTSICQGRLFLRSQAGGHTDSYTWKNQSLKDLVGTNAVISAARTSSLAPSPALVNSRSNIINTKLGFELEDASTASLEAGQWYKSKNYPGVYLSAMKARFVPENIMRSYSDRVMPMNSYGPGESDEVVDSVAIDLSEYRFGWNTGTDLPGVKWSNRAQTVKPGAGPDGFGDLKPLAFPGTVNPLQAAKAVAVLTGGFERRHSAFRLLQMSTTNRGHHYGYMEKGVVMSTIVPNLASLIIYRDGNVDIKTWTLADNASLANIQDIRQNGVPLIEWDASTGQGIPHALVRERTAGNWSATAQNQVKIMRASACILERDGKRFLMFSYFSSHSPSGMARVLQAYQCKYAIHLDMNAPRFAYSAFFTTNAEGDFRIEHLSTEMVEDVTANGKRAPRNLLVPSYKDFFYVMKK